MLTSLYENKISQPINIDKCGKIVIGLDSNTLLLLKVKWFKFEKDILGGMSFLYIFSILKANRKDDYHAINSS